MSSEENLRLIEAVLFASSEPLSEKMLVARLPDDADVKTLLKQLKVTYAGRGVNLVQVGTSWGFRTAPDLGPKLAQESEVSRKLSRAAIETLAIIAYHQPVTRGEVEEIRGVSLSKGTLDLLFEAGWIRPGAKRKTPGRPLTWKTSDGFLDHFGLSSLKDLPGVQELKAAGLLDARPALDTYGVRGALGGDEDTLPLESDLTAPALMADEPLDPDA